MEHRHSTHKVIKHLFALSAAYHAVSMVGVLVMVLICTVPPVSAQNIRFKNIALSQGLSQSSVQAMIQDRRGFLWFGTQDGLNCYDGYTMTVYRSSQGDSTALPNSFVQTLYEDRSGALWVGTLGGGAARMQRSSRRFTTFQTTPSAGAPERNIYALTEDNIGRMWLATSGGLLRLNPQSGLVEERFTPQNSPLSSIMIRTLATDAQGCIWIGTPKGLYCYNPSTKEWNTIAQSQGLANNDIRAVAADYLPVASTERTQGLASLRSAAPPSAPERPNALWVGTANGIYRVDCLAKRVTDSYPAAVQDTPIQALSQGMSGTLWVGYAGEGLQMINTRTRASSLLRHAIGKPESLSHNAVLSVFVDRQNMLWVGTDGAGVCYFNSDEYRFEFINNDNGSGTNIVMSMLEDKQGFIWFGTLAGGLQVYDPRTGTIRNYQHNPNNPRSISSNFIWSLAEDRSGALWIGTNGGGLCRFDRASSSFTTYRHDDTNPTSLPDNTIHSLLHDTQGRLWIATDNGLAMMNRENGTFTTFRNTSGTAKQGEISSNAVRTLYESRRGALWVCTRGGGLNRFDPATGTFETFRHSASNTNSLSSDEVMSIREDSKGILWIGTVNGLNRFDPANGSFSAFHEKDGLPNKYVCSIIEDSGGLLWLATGRGISRFNPHNGSFSVFEEVSIRAGSEFNQDACLKDHAGYMYFGSVAGFVRFHPDSVQTNYLVPPIVLTAFKRFNKPVELDTVISEKRELHLSVDDSFIAFEFAALSFSLPDKIRYSCRLENFDTDWVDLGTKREATYTNLEAGEYTLHVRATNYDGIRSNDGVTLRIIIHPHWWQTVWAKLVFLGIVVIIGVGLYQWRVRRIEKHQRELEQTINERTAELSAGSKEIKRQNDVLLLLNTEKNEFLGIAAHDLKNPLTSIILSASIIQQYQSRMTVAEFHEQTNHILITARRMQETILNLLDINAIESGRFKFSPIAMNIVEVVNDVVEGYYLRAKDKDIRLHFNHESDEIMMLCDRNALMQILENLISNAIKYSPLSTSVYVTVSSSSGDQLPTIFAREEAAIERVQMRDRHARVEIQDEGPGLTPDDKEQLFNKFAKLSAKPTGGEHSTGLGLSIVKKIAEAMGGRVWCESELGKGATFIVELPIVEVPEELLLERLS